MPAAVQETNKAEHSDQMWKVLKIHLLRERARKKQEREQEVEEERLRKEREAREQQDVMTLGETREQISQLETKLQQLKEEKHQLFLQLKKVLNEDDNRRRQLVKENAEQMMAMQTMAVPPANMVPNGPSAASVQLYIQQQQQQQPRLVQPQQQSQVQPGFKTNATVKRPRSPSPPPPPPQQVPVSLYHAAAGYGYKPPPQAYQGSPQKDDGRRNELVRAVLWNKTPQYASQPSAFYPVPSPQDLPIYYPLSREPPPGRVYGDPPRPQPNQPPYHLEPKQLMADHYVNIRASQQAPQQQQPPQHPQQQHIGGHVMGMSGGQQGQPKGGSITAGYPVRSQPQYQQAPSTSLYSGQTRPLYQTSGAPLNYPTRD
ncbi:unnamed protein product [Acanthoscelides obtectus]|uniref:G protein pathway suppressor 2 n=2 Tax=Acanthoscelides obtectus TaxID=200917 RepID=A0A9P0KI31_ACAOB|nr:unnamed protein product [Acanthoscelides obtectus]CAK1681664.1 G protein pathway suppressor 2 [Acanthoscelides obtectus]